MSSSSTNQNQRFQVLANQGPESRVVGGFGCIELTRPLSLLQKVLLGQEYIFSCVT